MKMTKANLTKLVNESIKTLSARQNDAEQKLKASDNVADKKALEDTIKNCAARLKRLALVQNMPSNELDIALRHVTDIAQFVNPSNIYAFDSLRNLLQITHDLADADSCRSCFQNYFQAYKHSLTATQPEIKAIMALPSSKLTNPSTQSGMTRGISWALEMMGAAKCVYSGRNFKACTIDPEHEIIKRFKERGFIEKLPA